MGRVSPGLLSDALQMSLLCPSYEVACTVLKGRGIELNVKTLRRLCGLAGTHEINLRARISLNGEENLHGYTLVVSVDGGRLRERKRKRGRKAKKLKRQGYASTGSAQVTPTGVNRNCGALSLSKRSPST